MKTTFDRNLFTQIGLDSGSLTMLGGVTHRFLEPGQYRGVVYRGDKSFAHFYVNVDKSSPAAQANIDLASFESGSSSSVTKADGSPCGCPGKGSRTDAQFEVNPRGYAVFHVSAGGGGYAVRVGRAVEDPKQQNQFDSRELKNEDIFSAVILRPGTYSATNILGGAEKKRGRVTVSYLQPGKAAYRPPSPVKVECSDRGFEPGSVEIQPGQAVLFHAAVPSRIKLELVKADDGPGDRPGQVRRGWRKTALPKPGKSKA